MSRPRQEQVCCENGESLLNDAKNGDLASFRAFLESGVSVDFHDENKWTSAIFACFHNRQEILNELTTRNANLDLVCSEG